MMYDYWDLIKKYKELQQENKQLKEDKKKAKEYLEKFISIDIDTIILSERQRNYLIELLGDKENEEE